MSADRARRVALLSAYAPATEDEALARTDVTVDLAGPALVELQVEGSVMTLDAERLVGGEVEFEVFVDAGRSWSSGPAAGQVADDAELDAVAGAAERGLRALDVAVRIGRRG